MKSQTTLLIIDCQKDFHPGGSLSIPSADEDAKRIAHFIRTKANQIDRIIATLDSHQKLHIANPCFWWSDDGVRHPEPFTIITADDVRNGIWTPRRDLKVLIGHAAVEDASAGEVIDPTIFSNIDSILDTSESESVDITKYAVEYVERLEARGRFQLCIWPEHCLIGSPGHTMVYCIQEALYEWSETTGGCVEWVLKGQHILTEMFSALEAEIPVSSCTLFNDKLHTSLMASDRLLVCGQAMSHCVNYTLRDIVARWPKGELDRICLLTDCASAVPGFEAAALQFLEEMEEAGVRLARAVDLDSILL